MCPDCHGASPDNQPRCRPAPTLQRLLSLLIHPFPPLKRYRRKSHNPHQSEIHLIFPPEQLPYHPHLYLNLLSTLNQFRRLFRNPATLGRSFDIVLFGLGCCHTNIEGADPVLELEFSNKHNKR